MRYIPNMKTSLVHHWNKNRNKADNKCCSTHLPKYEEDSMCSVKCGDIFSDGQRRNVIFS